MYQLKTLLTSMASLICLTTVSLAADMDNQIWPQNIPQPPTYTKGKRYDWNGFYVGGNAGYVWGTANTTVTQSIFGPSDAFPTGSSYTPISINGFIGGGTAGFNWQFYDWLYGFEGEFMWTGGAQGNENTTGLGNIQESTSLKNNWLALAKARLGYADNNWLFFVTGGGAWLNSVANSQAQENIPQLGVNVILETDHTPINLSGWTVGGGIEWGFLTNWSAKLEYDFVDFTNGNVTTSVTSGIGTGQQGTRSVTNQLNLIRFGVNYRFYSW